MERSSATRPLTSRFVAGLELQDAMRVVHELQHAGMLATLDRLGENVSRLEDAHAARTAYLLALEEIAKGSSGATISIKVTALGLDISDTECLENASLLVDAASSLGSRVEFDMESSAYTDRTLRIVQSLHARFPRAVRAVIQAYLYRTPADIESLSAAAVPVRLCKGAYQEPPSVAYPEKAQVDAQYVKLANSLLTTGTHPAIATHDDAIVAEVLDLVRANAIGPERFEFQMLYGVRRDLQKRIVEAGYKLRLYVPYGEAWYPYFMRRLAERPAYVWFVLKSLWHD